MLHCTGHCTGKYRSAAHSISNLNSSVPKIILTIFQNGSNYLFTCLGEKYWKIHTFTVSIENEVTKIHKKETEIAKAIPYRLQCIDSARFMASPFSDLVNKEWRNS